MTHVRLPPISELPLSAGDLTIFNDISSVIDLPELSAPSDTGEPPPAGRGPWTQAEDKLLLDAMASFSGHICWEELSKRIPGRSAKQCRERWQFRLHPDVNKAPFEPWEDALIINERKSGGNHWAQIAMKLPGRTSCAVKNRWYTVLRNRKGDRAMRRSKVCTVQASPFYQETVALRDRKELWKKGSDRKRV